MRPWSTWDWILTGLDEALAFCRAVGLDRHVDGSRFQEYRTCIFDLVGALKAGGPEAARDLFDRDRVRTLIALTEGAELAESLPFIRSVSGDVIRRKLLDVLKGPVLPTDENTNTNQARNVLFELNLASRLRRAGLAPELGEHPDIRCPVDGRLLYIHCKRPFSDKSARQAYTDALGQIGADLRGAPDGARGVVALSITRLVNAGDQVFKHEDEATGKEHLSAAMSRAAETMIRTTDWPAPPPETIGILWHVITPGFDRSQALLVSAQHLNVQPTSPPGSADESLLRILFSALHAVWDAPSAAH